MYNARSLFLIYLPLYLSFHVAGSAIPLINTLDLRVQTGTSIYDTPCPDGLPGRVTRVQEETPSSPGILLTDCSPSRNGTLNPWDHSSLEKRQEQICPADCSNSCSGSGGGPSTNDCNVLINQLSDRNSQFTVGPLQTVHQESGTCMFSIVNMVSSSFIYCDSAWSSRSRGVVSSCLPASSGGMCQGSRFQAVVAVNPSAPSATPTPAPAATTPASGSGTTNGGNGGNSSNNGGASSDGNGASSTGNNGVNTNSGNASNSNGGASSSGSNTASGASVSLGGINTLSGTQSGGSGGSTTTLSNGSVLIVPTGSVTLPSGSGDPNGLNVATGEKSGSSVNVAAIVGAIIGILVLLGLLILFLLWRRKKKAERSLEVLEQMNAAPPRDSSVARTINGDSAVELSPVLGFGRAAGISPMTETGVGINSLRPMGAKARMMAEEAQPRRSEQTDLSSLEPSTYTGAYTDMSPVPVYRSRSQVSRDRRGGGQPQGHHRSRPSGGGGGEGALAPHHTGSSGSNRDAYASDGYSSISGSTGSRRTASTSVRTLAQAAGANLSPADIDRLAESIVARMRGGGAIAEETDDEPPPPWSPNRTGQVL